MSSAWMRHALDVEVRAQPGTSAVAQKAVLMVLAWHHHPDHDSVTMGTRRLGEHCGLSRQAVMRAIDALVGAGIVTRATPVGGRASYVMVVTPCDQGGYATQPVTPRNHVEVRGYATEPVVVTPCDQGWSRHVTGVVTPHDHVEIRDSRDEGDTPQPPKGGHGGGLVEQTPQLDTEPPYLPDDGGDEPDRSTLPTAADRVAARTPAAVRLLDPPHLTGQGDALAVAAWYVACCPRPGGPPPLDVQGIQTLVAEVGADDVIEAVQHFYANGAPFPQPRALRQRVKTVRVERIQAERTAASARRAGTASGVSLTHMMAGADPFKFGGGAI